MDWSKLKPQWLVKREQAAANQAQARRDYAEDTAALERQLYQQSQPQLTYSSLQAGGLLRGVTGGALGVALGNYSQSYTAQTVRILPSGFDQKTADSLLADQKSAASAYSRYLNAHGVYYASGKYTPNAPTQHSIQSGVWTTPSISAVTPARYWCGNPDWLKQQFEVIQAVNPMGQDVAHDISKMNLDDYVAGVLTPLLSDDRKCVIITCKDDEEIKVAMERILPLLEKSLRNRIGFEVAPDGDSQSSA
jgi:hypothetical protein